MSNGIGGNIKLIIFSLLLFYGTQLFSTAHSLNLYAYKELCSEPSYDPQCMPCTPSKNDPGTIAFTKHWKIVYVPNQSYLGRTVVSSTRHFGAYEEMTDEEAEEYRNIFKTLLPALKKTFFCNSFNVAYLMNKAFDTTSPEPRFKNGKPDPHFHWHIIPRYDGKRTFFGETFEDPDFGDSFNLKRKKILPNNFREHSIKAIRSNLNITYIDVIE